MTFLFLTILLLVIVSLYIVYDNITSLQKKDLPYLDKVSVEYDPKSDVYRVVLVRGKKKAYVFFKMQYLSFLNLNNIYIYLQKQK